MKSFFEMPKRTPGFLGLTSRVSVTLRLSGKALDNCTKIGRLKIHSAADDRGQKLEQLTSRLDKQLYTARPMTSGKAGDLRRWYNHTFHLNSPARGTKSIANVTGELTVVTSKTTPLDIPIKKLPDTSKKGAKTKFLPLAQKGIAMYVSWGNTDTPYISLRILGKNVASVVRVTVDDSRGKPLITAIPYRGFCSLRRKGKLPGDAVLKLHFETSSEKRIVRFALKDISLP